MKNVIAIYLTLIFLSCSTQGRLTKVEFRPLNESPKFSLRLASQYKIIDFSSIEERERYFIYPDSSFVYISSFDVSPNYDNINALGDSICNYRFQNKNLSIELNTKVPYLVKLLPDTFQLSGISKNNLFWKDIYIGNISIGYKDVPLEQKDKFDQFLSSLKIK
ncbi:hypothetical protein [Bacteroides sedimenti]|uniref:Lipoprotein n=1 Tax=Bacteroides sedimenti TaxID=2136147 RepID=A0ABM8IAM2_9BACE